MNVYGFIGLSESLYQAGYPPDWVSDRLIYSIPYYAENFGIRELMPYKGEQFFIAMDFEISNGRIILEELTGHLLKVPATEENIHDLNTPGIRDKWVAESVTLNDLIPAHVLVDTLLTWQKMTKDNADLLTKTTDIMNLNNLENLKNEMKTLGFKDKLIEQMEVNMKKDVPDFKLYDTVDTAKGRADVALHFKQSGSSDNYYLNKYDVSQNKAKPLEEGQKYWVILPPKDGKPQFRGLDTAAEAIELFKAQKGNSELSVGNQFKSRGKIADMVDGKVSYIAKDFHSTYNARALPQTFFVDRGKGLTLEQAVNLVEGRSVHRDDMLSREGVPYKAWVQLDTDRARDRFNNLTFKQFNDPAYGFDLSKVLDKFDFKELKDPAEREKKEASIRNGNRTLFTGVKDGQETKLYVEAVPRFSQINAFNLDGKPEKREHFLKADVALSQGNIFDRKLEQNKEKELSESQGIRR